MKIERIHGSDKLFGCSNCDKLLGRRDQTPAQERLEFKKEFKANNPIFASHIKTCLPVNYILCYTQFRGDVLRCVCNAFEGIVMCTFLLWVLLLLSENNFKRSPGWAFVMGDFFVSRHL